MNWESKYGDPVAHLKALDEDGYRAVTYPAIRKVGEKPVLLDGRPVHPETIDPQRHNFVGFFRPPRIPPIPSDVCVNGTLEYHYREGHFDLNAYETKR